MQRTALILILIFWAVSSPVLSQPKLEAFPEEFDFGLTVKDAAISTSVWLKSTGTDTVEITKISTGCECTTAPMSTDKIAPGDSTLVTFRWETERTFGVVNRYPRFYYKNSAQELRTVLKANILHTHDSTSMPISVWPFRFAMGKIGSVSVDSLSFKIVNITESRIIPTIKGQVPKQCEIFLPEIIPNRKEAWGYIKLKPEFANTEFDNSVTLQFSHDDKYFVTIPIQRKFYKNQ